MKTILNINKISAFILSVIWLLWGCTSNFDEINTNPDSTTKVKSSMLATNVILDMVGSYDFHQEFLSRRLFFCERIDDSQYNSFGKASFYGIRYLTDAANMVEFAPETDKNAYTGLFYFMKGWYFWRATMDVGDIPYSEALNIDEYPYPKYDEQKDVFKGILADLELADQYFGKATKVFEGDPFYLGDPVKWRKATNVLRLKVLMSLQKRADDTPELKIKEQFAQIVQEGNLFTSNDDNLAKVYSEKLATNHNPLNISYIHGIGYLAATNTFLDPLKEYKDKRMFYYFAPARALTDEKYLPEGETLLQSDDWNAYMGLDVAGIFSEEAKKFMNLMCSIVNDVYKYSYTGVPCIRLGYADMNFLLAEAAERGWIEGPAKKYYDEGVKASFDFVRTTVPEQYNNGVNITDEDIEVYLNGEKTAYNETGTSMDRLKQIWMQTYLAGYFHMAKDAYYNFRRTGYPEWPINTDTNLNTERDKIPVRWLYPDSENNYNKEQLKVALERQWGGEDDVNNVMWLIK